MMAVGVVCVGLGGWWKGAVMMATSEHLGSLFSRTVISNLPGAGFPHATSNLNKAIAD